MADIQYRIQIEVSDNPWSRQHGTVGMWRDGTVYDTRAEAEAMVADLLAIGTNARIKEEPAEK